MKINTKMFVKNMMAYMETDAFFSNLDLKISTDSETASILAEIPGNGTVEIIFDSVVREQRYCVKRTSPSGEARTKVFDYQLKLENYLEENYNLSL